VAAAAGIVKRIRGPLDSTLSSLAQALFGMASSAATNGDSSKINGSLANGSSSSTSWRAAPMSNSTLEAKAKQLREESAKHSAVLTQKLANSDSGQNLLHIGTALSSLPPDLHSALSSLQPLTAATATSEEHQTDQLTDILKCRKEIEHQRLRCRQARNAIDVYGDLVAVETTLQQLAHSSSRPPPPRDQHANSSQNHHNVDENEEGTFITSISSGSKLCGANIVL
jgi:hypothetical protein